MADLLDNFPLAGESPESILARYQADVNAGIDPTDPLYADVQPGSVWDDLARCEALELDRVYDRALNEVPAAALPALATGVWLDAWADTVGLERNDATPAGATVRFRGPGGTDIATGTQVSTEAPTPDAEPITFQTTAPGTITDDGFVDLDTAAVEEGTQGNVAANAITLLDSAISSSAPVTVSNPAAATGGSDVESDERLQKRVLKMLRGTKGAGNVEYYENIALNFSGVGFVTVFPNTPAIGDVSVVITDVENRPFATTAVIDGLQAVLDPSGSSTQGAGQAAIGADVTVSTPDDHAVPVTAAITPESGYSLDGTGGARPLAAAITAAITRYIDSLEVGEDVVVSKLVAAIVDVDGVADATVSVPAGNVAIAATEVAVIGAVSLT